MMLDTALTLARRGLAVFPCHADRKTPITKRGFKDATKDAAVIRAWWGSYPAANIAVATGGVSGVVVVDVDIKKGLNGEADLVGLEQKHGALPATVESITPSKGRHLWFAWPGRRVPCSVGATAPGLDIRGDGGYVLAPPSHVVETGYAGKYIWSVESASAFAPLPEWLLERTRAPRPDRYFAEIANGVPEGRRNDCLASLCGKLLHVGLSPRQTYEYLSFWNQGNVPPLEEDRIKIAVRNIAWRENGKFR